MNLPCLFLFCFGLLNSQVSSAPGLSPPGNNDEFADHQDTVSCGELSDTCAGCLTTGVSLSPFQYNVLTILKFQDRLRNFLHKFT